MAVTMALLIVLITLATTQRTEIVCGEYLLTLATILYWHLLLLI
jgi:hypothetical protein